MEMIDNEDDGDDDDDDNDDEPFVPQFITSAREHRDMTGAVCPKS